MGDAMIDIRKLKELVRLMVENDLSELDLKDEQEQVVLRRAYASAATASAVLPAAAAAPAAAVPAAPATSAPAPASPSGDVGSVGTEAIESPMVGTFYSSPDPESPEFVRVGDTVTPDTVVCIVEAMKVFSEIKADRSGVVTEVCVANGSAVEYGQPLFRIKPS